MSISFTLIYPQNTNITLLARFLTYVIEWEIQLVAIDVKQSELFVSTCYERQFNSSVCFKMAVKNI